MLRRFLETAVRHRTGLGELALFLVLLTGAGFLMLAFDLTGGMSGEQRIELLEVVMLGALVVVGVGTFSWRRFSEQEREIAARTTAEDRAQHLAHHDHLTGLPNRRELQKELSTVTRLAPVNGGCHVVLLMDLNGFKKVNDVFGHAAGDELLCIVAQRVKAAVHPKGLLARTGGDEFAVVVRNVANAEAASNIALSIANTLEDPISTSMGQHQIGTGVGIALCPQDGMDPGDLLRKADAALYKSKQQGGFAFFTEEMEREARERDRLHRELAASIAAQTILPYYQPIVHLDTGEIQAFEALARWTHPELGSIPPDRFIPIAEDSGLIKDLTDSLLRQACLDAAQWPRSIGLSFNVSPALLRDSMFPLRVMAILAATGFSPSRLELEITENAIVKDLEAARDTLGALREAGIKIALDDFGTGATSLFHLRSFKFDVIKIDRSFVHLMATENESAQIVKAVLGLANGLDVSIIAEGVEDEQQRALLRSQGCQDGQGYLFSQAVSAAEATDLLRVDASKRVQI